MNFINLYQCYSGRFVRTKRDYMWEDHDSSRRKAVLDNVLTESLVKIHFAHFLDTLNCPTHLALIL